MGGELVSCSKSSLINDRTRSYNKESEVNRVEVEDEEQEEENKEVENKKYEIGYVGENSCETGKICSENEQERENMRGTWGTDQKRSKLGERWSKLGDGLEEKVSTDRRSRSESDLLSDLSRSA